MYQPLPCPSLRIRILGHRRWRWSRSCNGRSKRTARTSTNPWSRCSPSRSGYATHPAAGRSILYRALTIGRPRPEIAADAGCDRRRVAIQATAARGDCPRQCIAVAVQLTLLNKRLSLCKKQEKRFWFVTASHTRTHSRGRAHMTAALGKKKKKVYVSNGCFSFEEASSPLMLLFDGSRSSDLTSSACPCSNT